MKEYQSWGHYPPAQAARVIKLHWRPTELPALNPGETILPYGLGRSQGDSCLNDRGVLIDTSGLDRFMAFDTEQGVLTCEAGVSLDQILQFTTPRGWFLPVVPGTKHVTIAGAVANDVHGKNHVTAGTFGSHVIHFELLRSDGRYRCSPTQHPELFAATIGGLGLTGLIMSAAIQLQRVPGPWMKVARTPFHSLAEGIEKMQELSAAHEYIIGQFDALSARTKGRGVLMMGDHTPELVGVVKQKKPKTIPIMAPNWILNDVGMKIFNTAYHFKQTMLPAPTMQHYDPYFFPLDGVRQWNNLYGARGFVQYQSVVPSEKAPGVYERMIDQLIQEKHGSYLSSLKIFGNKTSPGLLSFPRPGIVVAFDFPMYGDRTLKLLEQFDQWACDAGGAVYPAKDARMSAHSFKTYFPRWQQFQQYIDPQFSSSFWRRVNR